MGLGGMQYVSLKEARDTADKWRVVVRQGKAPIKEREKERRAAVQGEHTLAAVAEEAFEARKAELKTMKVGPLVLTSGATCPSEDWTGASRGDRPTGYQE